MAITGISQKALRLKAIPLVFSAYQTPSNTLALTIRSWKAEVAGRVQAEAKALTGPTSEGKPPRMENLPGAETGPGQVATQGKSVTDHADALVFHWDREGQSSKHITFDWNGPDD